MRFKFKRKHINKLGDERVISKFLFLPRKIGRELRWLEFVKIKQIYSQYRVSYDMGIITENGWVDKAWVPSDPIKDCPIYLNEGCVHVDGMMCDIEKCVSLEKENNNNT